jgi:hypothetical protein
MSDEIIYTVSTGNDNKWYVHGPGNGMGYYSGTLWPELRWETREDTERAANIANIAYEEGYKRAQADMREAMGID